MNPIENVNTESESSAMKIDEQPSSNKEVDNIEQEIDDRKSSVMEVEVIKDEGESCSTSHLEDNEVTVKQVQPIQDECETSVSFNLETVVKLSKQLNDKIKMFQNLLRTETNLSIKKSLGPRLKTIVSFTRHITVNENEVEKIQQGLEIVGEYEGTKGYVDRTAETLKSFIENIDLLLLDYQNIVQNNLSKLIQEKKID